MVAPPSCSPSRFSSGLPNMVPTHMVPTASPPGLVSEQADFFDCGDARLRSGGMPRQKAVADEVSALRREIARHHEKLLALVTVGNVWGSGLGDCASECGVNQWGSNSAAQELLLRGSHVSHSQLDPPLQCFAGLCASWGSSLRRVSAPSLRALPLQAPGFFETLSVSRSPCMQRR